MTPIEYLYSLELHGIKLGLENIHFLLERAGDPHRAYPTVHVGGSNGKGSVVAMLDAVLQAAGYRTGRFTSPHLCNVRERFLVDSQPISVQELDEHIDYFREIAEDMPSCPTFFELNTAIAFRHFEASQVDIALIEVGMGGRFDSTNVIMPVAACITNIALEHTRYLGETLEAIAFEKAGIVKQGVPLVLGEARPGPYEVIARRADEEGSEVLLTGREFTYALHGGSFELRLDYEGPRWSFADCELNLAGAYQGANAAMAVALAEVLASTFDKLTVAVAERGLREARWPCRLERVLESPEVIIDVAHNAAGAAELAGSLAGPCVAVLAIANDKDTKAIIETVASRASTLILTQFEGARALSVDVLCEQAGGLAHRRAETLQAAIALGMKEAAARNEPLVIAGSLFTAGEARSILIDEYGARPLEF